METKSIESVLEESVNHPPLRPLEAEDAEGMLSWMHDASVACLFQTDFRSMELTEAQRFIDAANRPSDSLHLAIENEDGSYLGTISLKNIDTNNMCAEYAISTISAAHGTGVASRATRSILEIAFDELGLHRVYLNVLDVNERAQAFYKKAGFSYEGTAREALKIKSEYHSLLWFAMLKSDFIQEAS